MDRQAHDYAAAMAFAQHQQQQGGMQQQQFGFHSQPPQFAHPMHGSPFMTPHPSLQQYPSYHGPLPPQQQMYPHPHHLTPHIQHQQQPPTAFAPHLPPNVMPPTPFMHPLDSTPPPAAPPLDPELHKRIDKLVEYAAKNGPEFEAMIRDKQHDNPEYSFLFGGEGHNYYRYKLWLSTRSPGSPFNSPYPSASIHMMHSPHNSMVNLPLGPASGPPAPMLGTPQMHQPYPPFHDQHQQPPHSQHFMVQGRSDYESPTRSFKGLSGPLPSDVAMELNNVLSNLTGTKESIKGAKMWFMQRSPFAPALAEALRDRIFALDDSERQLHIIFLANDILFDSLQRRSNPQDLDNVGVAFKTVLGSMLARIYNNPQNKGENQSRLEKILQFWASKEVYDQETIAILESEMTSGLPFHSTSQKEAVSDPSAFSGLQPPSQKWQLDKPGDQQQIEKQLRPLIASQFVLSSDQQFPANQFAAGVYPAASQTSFLGSLPIQPTVPVHGAAANLNDQSPPPYPLFPPGLIPGMVRKMQIGSGVPYSPLSPLDIPTVIPPSTVPESEILERVSRFFKEIREVNPSEGPMKPTEADEYDDYDKEPPVRKGGACIPPPPNLQVDPETGMRADGTFDSKPGSSSSGRLGLGATANPNEASQYDDVYASYRKQRSTGYHSSMSARAASR